MSRSVEMVGVHEYAEEMPVELAYDEDSGRVVVVAKNEAGFNHTRVDLINLLAWLERHPDWLALLSGADDTNS